MPTNPIQKIRQTCSIVWKQRLAPHLLADRGLLAVILAIALGLRIYFAFASDIVPQHIDLIIHNRLAADGGFEMFEAPLYPMFLRGIYKLFGRFNYRAVFMIQGLFSFASVALLYAASTRVCGRRIGLITASLAAIFPDFINYNQVISPVILTVFAVTLLMYCAASGLRNKSSVYCSAAVFGLGILAYPPLLLFLPGFLIVTGKRLSFVIILIIILAPWAIRNSVKEHKFYPVYDLYTYSIDTSRLTHAEDGWTIIERLYSNGTNIIGKRMDDQIEIELLKDRNSGRFLRAWVKLIITIAGLYGLIKHLRRNQLAIALPFIIYGFLIIMITLVNASARMLLMPIWLLYTAIAVTGRCSEISSA